MFVELSSQKGLQAIALRYFNAAGTEPQARVGELHDPETHLIPRILFAASQKQKVQIFGTDYPTPDGTCIRDYVHVWDLAEAHGIALTRLLADESNDGRAEFFNLGSARGYSVREVIREAEKITGLKIAVEELPPRPGDPPRLVADPSLAQKELGFSCRYSSLAEIIDGAWKWHLKARVV